MGQYRAAAPTAAFALTDSALRHHAVGDPKVDELRTEARLAQAANNLIGDRPAGLSQTELDQLHRWHTWITPYRGHTRGPFGILHQGCVTDIATYEQLDLTTAETCFRAAPESSLQV